MKAEWQYLVDRDQLKDAGERGIAGVFRSGISGTEYHSDCMPCIYLWRNVAGVFGHLSPPERKSQVCTRSKYSYKFRISKFGYVHT